jgi:pimeloyl-ACP methyl ester carboxylesterase
MTPHRKANLSMGRLADDLAVVLSHAGVGPAIIIGHSLGVQAAIETWRRHPSAVSALILLCGVPGKTIQSIDKTSPLRFVIPSLYIAELVFPQIARSLLGGFSSRTAARLALWSNEINRRLILKSDLEAYFKGIQSSDLGTVVRMARFADAHDATPYLPLINVPTLIMGGRLDRFTPPRRMEEMAALIPGAELTITRRGSHALPVEQPDFVNLRIDRFLKDRGLK